MTADGHPPQGQRPNASDTIRAARVICLLALVYMHVPPWGLKLGEPPRALLPFDYLFVFMQEALGRTSVPVLSAVSGYLLVKTERGRGYAAQLWGKVRTLLVPLLLWNLIAAALHLATGNIGPTTPLGWANRLLALTDLPLIQPLYFLRDVFITAALFPIMAFFLRRGTTATLIVLTLLGISGLLDLLFLNALIPVFYAAGAAIALGSFPIRRMPPFPAVLAGFVIVAVAATVIALARDTGALWARTLPWPSGGVLIFVQRLTGALLFWSVAMMAAGRPIYAVLRRIEPFIFFTFCAHALLLGVMWRGLQAMGVEYGDAAYALWFLTAPLAVLATAVPLALALLKVAPGPLKLLCGGRLPTLDPVPKPLRAG